MKRPLVMIVFTLFPFLSPVVHAGHAEKAVDSLVELAGASAGASVAQEIIPEPRPAQYPGAGDRTAAAAAADLAGLVESFLRADEPLRITLIGRIGGLRTAGSNAFLKAVSGLEVERPAVRAAACEMLGEAAAPGAGVKSGLTAAAPLAGSSEMTAGDSQLTRPEKLELLKQFLRTVTGIINRYNSPELREQYGAALGIRG
ncbi:MAG: hypothetical protein M0011_00145 [Elusimicrobia bacterium]|nr:hypothetical protein [Elusimicrobiota bacterium]